MRRYELMLLFRPDLEDDKLQAAVEKVTRAIVNGGGALTKVSPWGKRRLAYEIQHFRDASYFLIHFDIAPGAVREIERGLLISEEILRHLVIVLEDRGPASEEVDAVPARGSEDEDGGDDQELVQTAEADADAGAGADAPDEEAPATDEADTDEETTDEAPDRPADEPREAVEA
jgi:small subunit ribosomal protein S6